MVYSFGVNFTVVDEYVANQKVVNKLVSKSSLTNYLTCNWYLRHTPVSISLLIFEVRKNQWSHLTDCSLHHQSNKDNGLAQLWSDVRLR